MNRQFEVRHEGHIDGTPEQVWAAVSTPEGTAGWIWPMEYDAGTEMGSVKVWEPGARLVARDEGPDGFFNNVEHRMTAAGSGTDVSYTHTGVFDESEWDVQYDACAQHTRFYMHTLGEYVAHFAGRTASYASVDGPDSSGGADAFTRLLTALGVPSDAVVGSRVRLTVDGLPAIDGVVDYADPNFVGIRTDDTLIRLFGRNVWGWPVGVTLHSFDGPAPEQPWRDLLTRLYA